MGAVIHCSMRRFIGLDFYTGSFHLKKKFINATHLIINTVIFWFEKILMLNIL